MQANTATAPAPATPQPSMPSSGNAPSAGYPQAQASAPQPSYQTAGAPSYQVPQGAPAQASYPSAPAQVAPGVDQWQASYQGLIGSPNAMPSSPAQVPFWPTTQAPAQMAPQGPVGYPQSEVAPSYQVPLMPGWMPSAPAATYTAQQAPQSALASDSFLDRLSNQSLEVIQHFGAEAPVLLNSYACVLEDGLIQQAQQTQEARAVAIQLNEQLGNTHAVLMAAAEDNAAFQTLLSDPRLLANYTNDFFGPNGVYPVITSQDRLRAEVQAGESGRSMPAPRAQLPPSYQPQGYQEPVYQAPSEIPRYERPQMEIQAPIQAIHRDNGGELGQFSELFDRDPAAAAAALHTLTPQQLSSMLRPRGALIGE